MAHLPAFMRREVATQDPLADIESLSVEQRKELSKPIYEVGSSSPEDIQPVLAVVEAAQRAGLPLVVDKNTSEEHGMVVLQVLSASENRHAWQAERALIEGAAWSLGYRLELATDQQLGDESVQLGIDSAADELINSIVGNQEIYEMFSSYYSGLRWGSDQEKFTKNLFIHSAEYDEELLEGSLSRNDLYELAHYLDFEIPYSSEERWYEMSTDEILKQQPQLDYHALGDQEFRESSEGQELLAAYKKVCGGIITEQYKAHPAIITEAGEELRRPLIPLSKFPVIEGAIAAEVSFDRPKAKYDFGASDVVEMVLRSDSDIATSALLANINARTPKEYRHVFDGPSEFKSKGWVIHQVLATYRDSEMGSVRRDLMAAHVHTILGSYSGNGENAASVREDVLAYSSDRGSRTDRDASSLRRIVSGIVSTALSQPDGESYISRLFSKPNSLSIPGAEDILEPDFQEYMFALLDSLGFVDENTNPEIYQRFAMRLLNDEYLAGLLVEMVALRQESVIERAKPDVRLAHKGLRHNPHAQDDSEKAEVARSRQHFTEMTAKSDSLRELSYERKNEFVLHQIEQLIEADAFRNEAPGARQYFEGLIKELYITGPWDAKSLPKEYAVLMEIAANEALTSAQISNVIWRICEAAGHSQDAMKPELVDLMLDMFEIILGPPEQLRMPEDSTSNALAAINHMSKNNNLFKFATEDQILKFDQYVNEFANLMDLVANRGLNATSQAEVVDENAAKEQERIIFDLRYTAETLDRLAEQYQEYLFIEEVKINPSVFYPWVLGKLIPLWHGLQREVDPGNRPNGDMQRLFSTFQNIIRHQLKFDMTDFPEDYDFIGDGGLGELVYQGYKQMLQPHHMGYNGTVWREGHNFMYAAASFMPPDLASQLKSRYGDQAFNKFIDNHQDRRN